MRKPLVIDLYCGLGGWAEAFLDEGYIVIGFDIERHDYGTGGYPSQLVLQDVTTLDGQRFKDASVIVASPPCQAYSYRAMPWKRAKALPPPDNTLFEACFRIRHEASEAAGHKIPLIVENVRGAQKWVGKARWHFGSYYLWGDVPALMPIVSSRKAMKGSVGTINGSGKHREQSSWDHVKHGGDWFLGYGGGFGWDHSQMRYHNSKSPARKAASALIAKIPYPLAVHIARVFKPRELTGRA